MRIEHIVAGLAPNDGGPSYTVPSLAAATREVLVDGSTRVHALESSTSPRVQDTNLVFHAPSRGLTRLLRGSRSLRTHINRAALEGAILHVHGIWLLPNVYPAVSRRRWREARLIHAPRGMLAPEALSISKRRKQLVWHLLQKRALAEVDCFHATASSEYREIRAMGLTQPVAIIPNGIDIPELQGVSTAGEDRRIVLSLGRIHPKKGLDLLLRAWAAVESRYSDCELRIVGPAERGHDNELLALARSLGLRRATILPPVWGDDKLSALREASLFVLPTRNENFGVTVAEALAAGTPVISTRGAPWAGLVRENCGWWVDRDVEVMTNALLEALATSTADLVKMGLRGRAWMERDFAWPRIANHMIGVYRWLLGDAQRPSCVHLD